MKPGIENGIGIVEITVTPDMTARLDEKLIHPVYSTFWLAYHAEVAARRAIEPFFDEGDNAVGSSIQINHKTMAGIGARVQITARVSSVKGRHVLCTIEVVAQKTNTLLAEGTQGQVLMSSASLAERCKQAEL
ncbi:MAG TPA: hotdog domain-containing protein [Candidatus Didemnitutus sp.]|nr:hotdog domain-containing protein [Candidatus Didemnitutus sp.]